MMKMQKSKSTKIAVTVSLVIHIIAFMAFAWVKLYTNEDIKESEIAVTFVQELKTKVLRRSMSIRPALLGKSSQRPSGQQATANLSRRTSSDFYVVDAPTEVFSNFGATNHMMAQDVGMQRLPANFGQNMVKPMTTELRDSSPLPPQMQSNDSIHTLFADDSLALAKPEMHIAVNNDNNLGEFFDAIRKKIESRKKYPESARNAGFEGRSGVKITILKSGQLENAEIVDSSGREILDNAALQSVRDAAPFPPLPVDSEQEKIGLRIYLVFRLS